MAARASPPAALPAPPARRPPPAPPGPPPRPARPLRRRPRPSAPLPNRPNPRRPRPPASGRPARKRPISSWRRADMDGAARERALEEIAFCEAILAKGGLNVLSETFQGVSAIAAWDHYPEGDVFDPASNAQWFYHCHP